MKFSQTLLSAAAAIVTTFALVAPAQAALPAIVTACSVTDLSPAAGACQGFLSGQYLSGSPADLAVQTEALGLLGLTWDGTFLQMFSGLGGQTVIDFAGTLTGTAYLGVHYGGGGSSPAPGGDSTAFYRYDNLSALDVFTLNFGASSDVKLYSATVVPGIPEPETYALLLAGLGAVGFMAKRRRTQA